MTSTSYLSQIKTAGLIFGGLATVAVGLRLTDRVHRDYEGIVYGRMLHWRFIPM
ncbi:hypothetical protein DAEQUDRAFT_732737, partial [Daedalea quercina L-15889]